MHEGNTQGMCWSSKRGCQHANGGGDQVTQGMHLGGCFNYAAHLTGD